MLRKHFNSMSKEDMKYLPFYSWQCLSLQLSHRDVDLVITREQDMGLLLKYLIHNMRTLDGERGSADKLLSFMQRREERKYMKENKKDFISESVR